MALIFNKQLQNVQSQHQLTSQQVHTIKSTNYSLVEQYEQKMH